MFDAAVVAIEAEGPPPAAYVRAAVQGCESALGAGRCAAAEPADAAPPVWHAIIRPSLGLDGLSMVIEVRRDGALFAHRELAFIPQDGVYARWLTAGVVIAAVVSGELTRASSSEPANEPEPEAVPHEPTPATTFEPIDAVDRVPSPPLFQLAYSAFELVAFSGAEVYQGPLEYGALLRAKLGVFGQQFLLTGMGGSAVPGNPLIVQTDAFVGVGTPLFVAGAFALDVSAAFVGEWLWTRHQAASGRRDAGDQFRFGAAIDVDARIRVSGCWAAVAGGHSTFLWPEVDIRRPPEQVAIVLPAGLGVALGVRYDLRDGC